MWWRGVVVFVALSVGEAWWFVERKKEPDGRVFNENKDRGSRRLQVLALWYGNFAMKDRVHSSEIVGLVLCTLV